MQVRKAVIPCAGLGTRMLPFSAAVPKELLPIGTLPVLQYVLCEAAAAGIETVVLVNADWKTPVDNYLQTSPDLLASLEASGKLDLIAPVLNLAEKIDLVSVRQDRSLGLGHAVSCAAPVVGDEPFAVLLPDEVILQTPGVLATLVAESSEQNGAVALLEVPPADISRYGAVELADGPGSLITDMVEKPPAEEAPSNFAIVGRYLFPEGFQSCLRSLKPGAGGELQLTDAMRDNLGSFPLKGVAVTGARYDTGNPASYAATWSAYLENPEPFDTFASGR